MHELGRHLLWGAVFSSVVSLPAFGADDACQMCFSPPNGSQVCVRNGGVRPIMATHNQPPYPQMSVMTNEQGTTLLSVEIGRDGAPTDVQVSDSSGSLRLDEAARDYVKETWRWTPPLKECGDASPKLRVSVKWDLRDAPSDDLPRPPVLTMTEADFPPDALRRKEQGTTFIFLVVRDNNSVAMAQISKSSGFADLDAKALELAKSRYHWIPALMDGKPVTTPIYIGILWPSGSPQR